jgi:alpha-beta hydrolase superfamily lysophospholipase
MTKGLLLTLTLLLALTTEVCGAVGYRETTWTYTTSAGVDRTIRLALWYPSSGPQAVRNFGVISGTVVFNGPLPTEVPAIIALSHGYLGCGAAMAYVAQSLASYGYAVIAPDHADTGMCEIGKGKLPLPPQGSVPAAWETRPTDLRAAIDAIQSFGVTSEVIIAAGHSFGGWTALAIDGVVPAQHDSRVDGVIAMAPNSDAARIRQRVHRCSIWVPGWMAIFAPRTVRHKRRSISTFSPPRTTSPSRIPAVRSTARWRIACGGMPTPGGRSK